MTQRTHPIVIPQNISTTIISLKAKNAFLIDFFTSYLWIEFLDLLFLWYSNICDAQIQTQKLGPKQMY